MWELFPRDFVNIQSTLPVRAGCQLRYVHINHILRKEKMNIEDEEDEVVPCQSQSQHWVLCQIQI